MPNYGFNENEIISTQTVMIDKDGFYKVVEGTSDNTGSKDFLCLMDASNGTEGSFTPLLMTNSDNGNITEVIEYTTTDAIYDRSGCMVLIAINPINTDKISNYPTSININDFEYDEFISKHNIINSEKPGWLHSSATNRFFNNVQYDVFDMRYNPDNRSSPYHLPLEDYKDNEAICKTTEDGNGYWYEFDATIILFCKANDEGIKNVCTDVLHIVTQIYENSAPK